MTVALLAPGFLFLLAATALLIVVSVSTPIWHSVYFLEGGLASSITSNVGGRLPTGLAEGIGTKVRFGIWGYCAGDSCTSSGVGYSVPKELFGGSDTADVISKATSVLVLHPIAAAMAAFGLVFALCGNLVTGLMASVASFLAFIIALIAFIADLAIFITAKNRIDDLDAAGTSFGNALWMTLAAVILLLLASFTVCCAHRRNRRARNVGTAPMAERRRFWQRRP